MMNTLQTTRETNRFSTLRPVAETKATEKSSSFKPQDSGLSREELRRIIIEMIG
jgi:hypothetical protein